MRGGSGGSMNVWPSRNSRRSRH